MRSALYTIAMAAVLSAGMAGTAAGQAAASAAAVRAPGKGWNAVTFPAWSAGHSRSSATAPLERRKLRTQPEQKSE